MMNGVVDTLLWELDEVIFSDLKDALIERKTLGISRYGKALSFDMKEVGKTYLMEEILDAIVYARHLDYKETVEELCAMYNKLMLIEHQKDVL